MGFKVITRETLSSTASQEVRWEGLCRVCVSVVVVGGVTEVMV